MKHGRRDDRGITSPHPSQSFLLFKENSRQRDLLDYIEDKPKPPSQCKPQPAQSPPTERAFFVLSVIRALTPTARSSSPPVAASACTAKRRDSARQLHAP
jgi:hypothetical protein